MAEPEKITIIEGPPPTFEIARDPWFLGLFEGSVPVQIALCRLRTFSGPALVERCYRAWREGQPITLEYRTDDGLTAEAPIVAARWLEVPEGHMLMIWVRVEDDEIEVEIDLGDSQEDAPEDPGADPSL